MKKYLFILVFAIVIGLTACSTNGEVQVDQPVAESSLEDKDTEVSKEENDAGENLDESERANNEDEKELENEEEPLKEKSEDEIKDESKTKKESTTKTTPRKDTVKKNETQSKNNPKQANSTKSTSKPKQFPPKKQEANEQNDTNKKEPAKAKEVSKPKEQPKPKDDSDSKVGNSSLEDQVIQLVNAERKKQGLAALKKNGTVTTIARNHSKKMAESGNLYHSDFGSALKANGVGYRAAGENVASGTSPFSPESVVQAWMNSSGHRANILNGDFTHIGVGYVEHRGYVYWTQIFYGN